MPRPTRSPTTERRRAVRSRPGGTAPRTRRRDLLAVRWRTRLARAPLSTVLVVAAAALAFAASTATTTDPGSEPGASSSVVVAAVDLGPGALVGVDDIEVRALPAAVVPAGSAATADDVVGRQVTAAILAGEAVVDARLAPAGLVGVAAATPPGWSSFALRADDALPPLDVGQVVDLYALDATDDLAATTSDARRVTRAASVVAVDGERVTVAVRPEDAPAVAAAVIGATVVVAVTGPSGAGDGP